MHRLSSSILVACLIVLCCLCCASAVVLNPSITYPSKDTQWTAGQMYDVLWDTDHVAGGPIPNNAKGTIYLGYLEGDDLNEHLYWRLASDFALASGRQNITLPHSLEPKTSYIVVLMGDSGNKSPTFEIKGPSS